MEENKGIEFAGEERKAENPVGGAEKEFASVKAGVTEVVETASLGVRLKSTGTRVRPEKCAE